MSNTKKAVEETALTVNVLPKDILHATTGMITKNNIVRWSEHTENGAVLHEYKKDKSRAYAEMGEGSVLVEASWSHNGFLLWQPEGKEYLCLRGFDTFPVHFGSVKDYKENVVGKNETPHIVNFIDRSFRGNHWGRNIPETETPECYIELRLYKTRKVVALAWFLWHNGTQDVFVVPADVGGDALLSNVSNRYVDEKTLRQNVEAICGDPILTEEEAAKHAHLVCKGGRDFSRNMMEDLIYVATDLSGDKPILWGSDRREVKFEPETKKLVEEFFGFNSPENKSLKYLFDNKSRYFGGYMDLLRTPDEGLRSLYFLAEYLAIRNTNPDAEKNRQQSLEEFAKTLTFPDNPNETIWERRGDEMVICCVLRATTKFCFIYNLKRKTRKVIYIAYDGSVRSPIPSLDDAILNNFHIGSGFKYDMIQTSKNAKYYWDCKYDLYLGRYPQKFKILGCKTVQELFSGTNVEWVLNNVPKDMNVAAQCSRYSDDVNDFGCHYSRFHSDLYTTVGEEINANNIGMLALQILATGGDKLGEQLLKNRLFNLYFAWLADLRNQGAQKEFYDESNETDRRMSIRGIPVNRKAKNLKNMLGMSKDKLLELDSVTKLIREEREQSKSIEHVFGAPNVFDGEWRIPNFSYMKTILGIDSFNSLDNATWENFILPLAKEEIGNRSSIFRELHCYPNIMTIIKDYKVKEKIKFIQNFGRYGLSTFNDYLTMRESLKKIQESKPDKEIYREEDYPAMPKKATKFITFHDGMEVPDHYNTIIVHSVKALAQAYGAKYGFSNVERHKEGILLNLPTPVQHMQYLHDELAFWVDFYRNEINEEHFQEAVKRVQPLEYKSPKYGLEIIAPKCSHDVVREGHVLSHCVSGFVMPIINGSENIMFIRRLDMPDDPYFTLDVVDGNIRQVHCYRNGNLLPGDVEYAYRESGMQVYDHYFNIIDFLKEWCKKVGVEKNSVKESYGMLCAN